MNIKEFKEKCLKEKERRTERVDYWKKLREEQAPLEGYIDPIRSFFIYKCPNCNQKLNKEIVEKYQFTKFFILTCPSCGYEYAEVVN